MKNFEEWLDEELNLPVDDPDYYDPNGNSSRAIVTRWKRSKLESLWFEVKEIAGDLKYQARCFNGLSTEIGWFIQWLLIPFIPVFVFTRTYGRVKSSLDAYKDIYKERVDNKEV